MTWKANKSLSREEQTLDKSKYFYRAAIFTRKNQEVALVDLRKPDNAPPLEPWLGTVVSLADGQHTLDELYTYLAGRYSTGIPESFDKTLESVLERLIDTDVIRYSDEAVTLPYYLDIPYEDQDHEKATKLMLEDGHLKH